MTTIVTAEPETDSEQAREPNAKDLRNLAELFIRASDVMEDLQSHPPDYEGDRDFGAAVVCGFEEVACFNHDDWDHVLALLERAKRGIYRHQEFLAQYRRRKALGFED
jgi:hypothetical protein